MTRVFPVNESQADSISRKPIPNRDSKERGKVATQDAQRRVEQATRRNGRRSQAARCDQAGVGLRGWRRGAVSGARVARAYDPEAFNCLRYIMKRFVIHSMRVPPGCRGQRGRFCSSASRLARGFVWPAYLLPAFCRYGTRTGELRR